MCTVVVRKNPCDHDCSSTTRKKKVKNATKHWICEKVKDWLIEDATLGAKELWTKLKEHYKRTTKKRTKTIKTAQSSILPCEDEAPTRMCFPQSQCLENTSNKNGKGGKSEFGGSKRSRTGSDQQEPISIEFAMPSEKTNVPVKVKAKGKKKELAENIPMVPLDSPAMGTRSKKFNPASPAMSTRSKRRLSL